MSRISTIGAFQHGLGMMQRLTAAIDRTQRQLTTGRRLLAPADDPIAAARALGLRESLSRLEQFDRNASMAQNRLGFEEAALKSVGDVLQRVRELALQAANASQSDESRHMIAVELRQHVDALVELANQQDGNGRFLFSGNQDGVPPVARNGDVFTYQGDDGQRQIRIGEERLVADGDPGSDVFFRIRDGNGQFTVTAGAANAGTGVAGPGNVAAGATWAGGEYTVEFVDAGTYEVRDAGGTVVATGPFGPGTTLAFAGIELAIDGQPAAGDEFLVRPSTNRDIFSTVAALADAIDGPVGDDAARAALTNEINAGILSIDQALGRVLDVQTRVGSRLSAIEGQLEANDAFALGLQETLAGIEDLDYAEALSRLGMQLTMLEAAQKAFVETRNLTLFSIL
jgi:flagellar hook-associated protein 3 FlgL